MRLSTWDCGVAAAAWPRARMVALRARSTLKSLCSYPSRPPAAGQLLPRRFPGSLAFRQADFRHPVCARVCGRPHRARSAPCGSNRLRSSDQPRRTPERRHRTAGRAASDRCSSPANSCRRPATRRCDQSHPAPGWCRSPAGYLGGDGSRPGGSARSPLGPAT